ncbi:MAG: FAD-dependent oxidoreductase [Proteobacteria bacterium]|nr:FAD-dependent oxidoreductase [Pseudomonadota bacterium]MBS0574170.1 FAD-dependent oxidoreductase [Pseudomonadota bacterium]
MRVSRKTLTLSLLVAVLAAGLLVLRRHPVDPDDIRGWVAALTGFRAAHPGPAFALAFGCYVLVTALSLPMAVWMTLAIGALFGFWQGLVLVSFAAPAGATLAFLAARWLLRDAVLRRFGHRLGAINAGIARDGGLYLFTLRLIPVLPFFLVNLLMGLTPMSAARFFLVSQAGMLAGTAAYVNAGTRLASIDSLSGILSAPMILSLAALGLVPWLARPLIGLARRRRLYRRWPRPRRFDRNLIVVGGGAAGLVAAYVAATVRAKVTLVEEGRMGGDCLNFGCVPSKALIRSAKLASQMRRADRLGLGPAGPDPSFRRIFGRIAEVIAAIAPHDSPERYRSLGVEVVAGRARLVDPWTVEVAEADGRTRRLTTRAIVLATGARPVVPPLPGLSEVGHLTTETLWAEFARRDAPPGRLVILGGGPAGAELAQAFVRLGPAVTLLEQAPRILSGEDEEVSDLARAALEADGVRVLPGHRALRCGRDGGGKWIEAEGAGGVLRLEFDDLVLAAGRRARTEGFGLEDLGIPAGSVIGTNRYLETLFPNIHAAGDAAGPHQLTHAAAHQAWHAAVNGLFGFAWRFRVDDRFLPRVTFLDPEIARVGPTEAEARARGIAFEVTRHDLADLDRAIVDGVAVGFVKVLTVPGKDRIIGVTIVGEHAGDLLAEFVLAMRQGLGLGRILTSIHAYPTFAEANRFVAGEWRKAHVSPRVLALLERLHRFRRGERG